jgi:hypothetical protein
LLPDVNGAEIKEYVDGILTEEAKHPAVSLIDEGV